VERLTDTTSNVADTGNGAGCSWAAAWAFTRGVGDSSATTQLTTTAATPLR
jgi:hypothetical protein